jgi:hypothetical protein
MSDSNDYTKRGKFCGSELGSQKATSLALAPVQIRYLPNVLKLDNIKHQPLEINKLDALQYGCPSIIIIRIIIFKKRALGD